MDVTSPPRVSQLSHIASSLKQIDRLCHAA
jgi:hypothetical protein